MRQHRPRCHRWNPRLLTPTTLIALWAAYHLLLLYCLPTATIVAATPSLLRQLLLHLPPPTLVAPSDHQRNDNTPTVVAVTSQCSCRKTLMSTLSLTLTVLALHCWLLLRLTVTDVIVVVISTSLSSSLQPLPLQRQCRQVSRCAATSCQDNEHIFALFYFC
jgi:hypothetical protein